MSGRKAELIEGRALHVIARFTLKGLGREVLAFNHRYSIVPAKPAAAMCRTGAIAAVPSATNSASIRAYQNTPSPRRLTLRKIACRQRMRAA
jgi:hypothetical protein